MVASVGIGLHLIMEEVYSKAEPSGSVSRTSARLSNFLRKRGNQPKHHGKPTMHFNANDVGVPVNAGHYVENTGDTDLVFQGERGRGFSLNQWIRRLRPANGHFVFEA